MGSKELRAKFSGDWERGVAYAAAAGASKGAVRALQAYAVVDVDETLEILRETRDDPDRSRDVSAAWLRWHGAYVVEEVRRLLPDLQHRWPGDKARWQARDRRKQLDRWCSDGEDVLAAAGQRARLTPGVVRRKLGLPVDRFDRVLAALVAIKAARVTDDGCLIQTAAGPYVEAQLRRRWLGEGSDAPDFIDPLPEGCKWKQPSDREDSDNR